MLRWLTVLTVLSVLTFCLGFGVIPTQAAGLARTLLAVFAGLLAASLVIGIGRGV